MTEITLVVKQGCETCTLIEPIMGQIAEHFKLNVICQDTPDFPKDLPVEFDASLEQSYRLRIEVVPTLIIRKDGVEASRIFGWDVAAWEALLGIQFKSDLPKFRPGCGSKTHDPGMQERLAAQFSSHMLSARRLNFENVDEIEIGFDQGWSDGLPVVPPTAERVMRMLAGTLRQPDEIIGIVPPDFAPCSIEKIAINAVLAGCRPEYLPVVIAAVEAVLEDQFCMHGLLATTYFSGPMVMVNGPVSRAIGMNSGGNALGQGNRANATIGRALQLIIRNVGGGRPGGVDRSALGNPGKYTFCFSEDET
ncbi:MAG: thioredoxin family protein, partial [Gammaproteobacteria bacterium]|nr:thioredoxin family protein [Gammaproteobacteria bacterium]